MLSTQISNIFYIKCSFSWWLKKQIVFENDLGNSSIFIFPCSTTSTSETQNCFPFWLRGFLKWLILSQNPLWGLRKPKNRICVDSHRFDLYCGLIIADRGGTNRHTDIATYRLKRHRNLLSQDLEQECWTKLYKFLNLFCQTYTN